MSSLNTQDPRENKASSLGESTLPTDRSETPSSSPRVARGGGRTRVGRRASQGWIALLVDVIVLCVLVGLVIGGWQGYRVLRDIYAPTWETREVVFCVEIPDVNMNSLTYEQGEVSFLGDPIFSSDRTDADCLGTVVSWTWERDRDDAEILTLYLTVEASALYREGKGYRMGATMLLAGMEGTYRMEGRVAKGQVISLCEKQEMVLPDEAETSVPLPTPEPEA